MSTKAIRKALELLDRLSDESSELVASAEAELEAIEQAAKAWGSAPEDTCPEETTTVLLSIARELP